jgi:hypothetical protein
MFATVEVRERADTLLLPDTAVLQAVMSRCSSRAENGNLTRIAPSITRHENDRYEVLSGEGRRSASSHRASSCSILKVSFVRRSRRCVEPKNASSPPPQDAELSAATVSSSSQMPPPEQTPSSYVCPMPEHATIKYDHPGKCPICSMTLIPAPEESAAKDRH